MKVNLLEERNQVKKEIMKSRKENSPSASCMTIYPMREVGVCHLKFIAVFVEKAYESKVKLNVNLYPTSTGLYHLLSQKIFCHFIFR